MSLDVVFREEYLSRIIWESMSFDDFFDSNISQIVAVVDSNAEWYFKQSIYARYSMRYFVFDEPDELKKNQNTVDKIHDFLFSVKADRKTILLVVGGGVTLDTAGFAASTYKRGIDWVAIPTTMLAQVDASVGGKTAINHFLYGKNVIGTFHPPLRVYIDSSCALTWTDELRMEGISEMYKIFKIFDHKSLNELLERSVDYLTKQSVILKAKVVDVDPYEMNLRAILNYGHTLGHALESYYNDDSNHRRLPHGIAVSIGMRIENYIAMKLSVMSEKEFLKAEEELNNLGFTNMLDEYPDFDLIKNYIYQDKKNEQGNINMCLVCGDKEMQFKPINPRTSVNIQVIRGGYEEYVKSFGRSS